MEPPKKQIHEHRERREERSAFMEYEKLLSERFDRDPSIPETELQREERLAREERLRTLSRQLFQDR